MAINNPTAQAQHVWSGSTVALVFQRPM